MTEMPAENTAFLGRTLFTDYLLPVELGGTLLLVAAIGTIAIAGRRTGELR
jgi:NADH:ubiquinone oxidoreductase subunit 6 (subunit J)